MNRVVLNDLLSTTVTKFRWTREIADSRKPLEDLSAVIDIRRLEELAALLARDKTVTVALVSSEYINIATLWMAFAERVIGHRPLFVACDRAASSFLLARQLHHIFANLGNAAETSAYLSPAGFTSKGLAITALKFPVVKFLIDIGYDVVLSDIDALWLKDPMLFIDGVFDVAFQRVAYFPAAISQAWGFAACSGFIHFRSGTAATRILSDCVRYHLEVHDDQVAFNMALWDSNVQWQREPLLAKATEVMHRHAELHANFLAESHDPIRGRGHGYDADLVALPHDLFWRHSWVPCERDLMVICHPNSAKSDVGKVQRFRELGVIHDAAASHVRDRAI